MATVRKPQEAPTSSPACTQEIPTLSSVYVVVGESYDQMEDNEKDVINIRHGILRIFANKEDVNISTKLSLTTQRFTRWKIKKDCTKQR